jgi:hypothetical protein
MQSSMKRQVRINILSTVATIPDHTFEAKLRTKFSTVSPPRGYQSPSPPPPEVFDGSRSSGD